MVQSSSPVHCLQTPFDMLGDSICQGFCTIVLHFVYVLSVVKEYRVIGNYHYQVTTGDLDSHNHTCKLTNTIDCVKYFM